MVKRRIRMSSKGQIVVPREVREKRGWGDGTVLELVDTPRGVLVRGASAAAEGSIDALVGCIPYRGPKHTVAEMNRAVLAEARRRGAR
jgi:AbrB family looped-hinge helix DNA binding protein